MKRHGKKPTLIEIHRGRARSAHRCRAVLWRTRFSAAFPWFDHQRWARSYDPVEHLKSHRYLIEGAPADAAGKVAIYTPGATHEQWVEVKRWLSREFNPKYDIPARHLLPKKMPVGHRHGSTLAAAEMTSDLQCAAAAVPLA